MKTVVSVPDSLFEAAERLARRMRVSRSELYQRAIAAYVKSHRHQNVTEALNCVYADEPDTSTLDSVLESMQSASSPDRKW